MPTSRRVTSIPVHVVTGFLGSGKSTLIRELIAQKPPHERWAVVINEFGQIGIDQALFDDREDVIIKGLPGGCLCCQLAFVLQASLVNLIHRHQPDRLLIEPSGLGHPAGLLEMLRGDAFSHVLELQTVVTLLDPRRMDDDSALASATFTDQLVMAEGIVLTMLDKATPEQLEKTHGYLGELWPRKRWIAEADHGRLPLGQLIEAGERASATVPMATSPHAHIAPATVELDTFRYREPQPGKPQFAEGESLGHVSVGWRWHADDRFGLDRLTAFFDRLPRGLRVKAIVHTDAGWKFYSKAPGVATLSDSAWRRDSRLEIIGEAGLVPGASVIETTLLEALLTD